MPFLLQPCLPFDSTQAESTRRVALRTQFVPRRGAVEKTLAIMIEISLPTNQLLSTYCQRLRILANIRHHMETAHENPLQ
jgi:hypothetical protein